MSNQIHHIFDRMQDNKDIFPYAPKKGFETK